MGFSISCQYFETFSTFLEWAVRRDTGCSTLTHHLDDFFFVGHACSDRCLFLLVSFCAQMGRFGVPLSPEKTEGPAHVLSFLGIEIDIVCMLFCLPQDMLDKLALCLRTFISSHKVTQKQMQSLLVLLFLPVALCRWVAFFPDVCPSPPQGCACLGTGS